MATSKYPFIIIGSDNCERCQILSDAIPNAEMIKIPNKQLGLGDSFAFITYLFRIESCRECKIRRSFLNRWFPYFWNASKDVRHYRNIILKLGHEELPVLLDRQLDRIHNIDDYVPEFNKKYMT